MMQLDDQFLVEVGLGAMRSTDRSAFLQHVYETLELRVGEALSAGLSDAQLAEYEGILDGDGRRVASWLETHAPDFLGDPLYVRMTEVAPEPAAILCEYAAAKWLDINRPDHLDVVQRIFAEIKAEIRGQAAQILAACDGSSC